MARYHFAVNSGLKTKWLTSDEKNKELTSITECPEWRNVYHWYGRHDNRMQSVVCKSHTIKLLIRQCARKGRRERRQQASLGNFGCLPFTIFFRKIRLESKWNTTFWVVLSENFREQQNIWKGTVKTRIQEHLFSGFRLIGFLYIGYFRWNQPESVLNFLLLKKCKGFTNYDEIHNFER